MDVYCPKCGHGFQYNVKGKRLMECQICKKDMFSVYPRILLTLQPEVYEGTQKIGFICKDCAQKIGISICKN